MMDEDEAYEMWREDWGNKLHIALQSVFEQFVKNPKFGYYKDHPERFLKHSISSLESITGVKTDTAFEVSLLKADNQRLNSYVESYEQKLGVT